MFYRLTDNWLELTIRFIVPDHGVRELNDAVARAILERFEAASIEIASATYAIAGAPPLRIQQLDAG